MLGVARIGEDTSLIAEGLSVDGDGGWMITTRGGDADEGDDDVTFKRRCGERSTGGRDD